MRDLPRLFWAACAVVFCLGVGLRLLVDGGSSDPARPAPGAASTVLALLRDSEPAPRTVDAYRGLGVWIDSFDFSPSYQRDGGDPAVVPDVVDTFAALGVETIYLQAARPDRRSPGRLLEEPLLGEFLLRAHARGLRVVGWYLPTFEDVDADLDKLLGIAEFTILGHRFDGIGVDIEYIDAVTDPIERSDRLVQLSARLRSARPGEALGAIVPPAVQMEVVNQRFWPGFPWRSLDPSYDVWLPMTYWTTRRSDSGYRSAYTYTEESTRRMRNNIGRDVAVHPIGGIGDETSLSDLDDFRRALGDTRAIGGSIYDWHSMGPDLRAAMADLLDGP